MSRVSRCNPPRRDTDLSSDENQLWECPICGQWWIIRKYMTFPHRISSICVILFHFSEWRHWRKAHNTNPRALFDSF